MTFFREWLGTLLAAPLVDPWGLLWARSHGEALDALLEAAKDAVESRGVGDAPADALRYHGRDRVIPAIQGEAMEAYRARLVNAWFTWSWATTRIGLDEAIILAGFGAPTLYTNSQLPRPPRADWWARFTVVFTGRFVWDGGAHWDGTADWDGRFPAPIETMDPVVARANLRAVLRQWKSARDRVTSVIIARGAWLWDTGERWDTGLLWDAGGGWEEWRAEPWDGVARWDSPDFCWDFFL